VDVASRTVGLNIGHVYVEGRITADLCLSEIDAQVHISFFE
jgi:hypothetical protein